MIFWSSFPDTGDPEGIEFSGCQWLAIGGGKGGNSWELNGAVFSAAIFATEYSQENDFQDLLKIVLLDTLAKHSCKVLRKFHEISLKCVYIALLTENSIFARNYAKSRIIIDYRCNLN